MEEPRMAQKPEQPEADVAPEIESTMQVPVPAVEETPPTVEEVPQVVEEEPARAETMLDLDKFDRETSGMTVGDGFRFGCGFVLALAIGTLAFLIVLTAFLAVGALMGFKLPFS